MADPSKGSIRDEPPHIHLFWRFFFWDVRTDVDNFGMKMLNSGGFEPQSTGKKVSEVSLSGHSQTVDVKFMRGRNKKKKGDQKGVPIGLLTADLVGSAQTVSLEMKPPPDHDSINPASPTSDSPRQTAKWNDSFQVQMRKVLFQNLEIDEDGYFVVDKHKFFDNDRSAVDIKPAKKTTPNYAMHACVVDKSDRDKGLAPHAYIKIYPREKRRKKPDFQLIEVDWEFDILRPNDDKTYMPKSGLKHYRKKVRPSNYKSLSDDEKKKVDKDVKKAVKKDEAKLRSVWFDDKVKDLARGKFNEPFLVMHITTGNRVESAIWTLSGDAAIHYICCLNGHVIKMVEDTTGCHHAGWKNQSKWRDFNWDSSIAMNRTAIGIEHVGVAGTNGPMIRPKAAPGSPRSFASTSRTASRRSTSCGIAILGARAVEHMNGAKTVRAVKPVGGSIRKRASAFGRWDCATGMPSCQCRPERRSFTGFSIWSTNTCLWPNIGSQQVARPKLARQKDRRANISTRL